MPWHNHFKMMGDFFGCYPTRILRRGTGDATQVIYRRFLKKTNSDGALPPTQVYVLSFLCLPTTSPSTGHSWRKELPNSHLTVLYLPSSQPWWKKLPTSLSFTPDLIIDKGAMWTGSSSPVSPISFLPLQPVTIEVKRIPSQARSEFWVNHKDNLAAGEQGGNGEYTCNRTNKQREYCKKFFLYLKPVLVVSHNSMKARTPTCIGILPLDLANSVAIMVHLLLCNQ